MNQRRLIQQLLLAIAGGAAACAEPPWEEDVRNPDHRGRSERVCYTRERIASAQMRGGSGPVTCPSRADLVKIGLFEESNPPEMSGKSLTQGPAEWKGECCYLVHHWHTG